MRSGEGGVRRGLGIERRDERDGELCPSRGFGVGDWDGVNEGRT